MKRDRTIAWRVFTPETESILVVCLLVEQITGPSSVSNWCVPQELSQTTGALRSSCCCTSKYYLYYYTLLMFTVCKPCDRSNTRHDYLWPPKATALDHAGSRDKLLKSAQVGHNTGVRNSRARSTSSSAPKHKQERLSKGHLGANKQL